MLFFLAFFSRRGGPVPAQDPPHFAQIPPQIPPLIRFLSVSRFLSVPGVSLCALTVQPGPPAA